MKILRIILAIFYFWAIVERGVEMTRKKNWDSIDIIGMLVLILSEIAFLGDL